MAFSEVLIFIVRVTLNIAISCRDIFCETLCRLGVLLFFHESVFSQRWISISFVAMTYVYI